MKKTKRTILTAAILTAASASSSNLDLGAKKSSSDWTTMTLVYGPPSYFETEKGEPDEMYDVYGPPSYFLNLSGKLGDVNEDGEKNIADYCLMLGLNNIDSTDGDPSFSDDVKNLIADINEDGFVDKYDFLSMRRYLFGIDDDLTAYYQGDIEAAEIDGDIPEVTECTECTWIPDSETVQTIITTYGAWQYIQSMRYSESVSQSISESESRAQEEATAQSSISKITLSEPIFQTKYGIIPIYNKEAATTDIPEDILNY